MQSPMTLAEILSRFDGVRRVGPNEWKARCSHHRDAEPSLAIKLAGQKLLLNCHAGCETADVLRDARLTFRDLDLSLPVRTSARLTLAAFAEAKALPVDFLRQLDVEEDERGLRITYRLADGTLAPRQRRRTALAAKDGSTWDGPRGESPVAYGLWRLDEAREKGELLLVEGETDTLAAWYHHVPCLGTPGADMTKVLDAPALSMIETLWIMREPDRGGATFVSGIARRLGELEWRGIAKVVTLDGAKDLHELHMKAGADFAARLQAAYQQAARLDEARMSPPPPTAPTLERHGDDFSYATVADDGQPIVITLGKVREAHEGIWAEVAVSRNGNELYFERINLLSSKRNGVIKTLTERAGDLEWSRILEPACRQTIEAIRRGTPAVVLRSRPAPAVRHLVTPVLIENEINVFFGPPGTLKSLIAATIARLVVAQGQLAGFTATRACPVMVLDGEANLVEWEGRDYRLSHADGWNTDGHIYYRRLTRALDTEAAALKAEISRLGIGLVIVDSFGMAAGSEPEGADAAIRLLSTLRGLGPTVTVLLICHVSHVSAEQKHGATKPYGSIYVQALGRSIWEARRDEEGGDDVLVSLFHRKCNVTRLHPPIALRFHFTEEQISVYPADLGEHPELLTRATLRQQVYTLLQRGHRTTASLAEALDAKPASVEQTIRRMRMDRLVDQVGTDKPASWGLVARR